MDAFIGLLFLTVGAVLLIFLYFATWLGSFVLVIHPRWVGDRIVLRFWPERVADSAALRNYRLTGLFGLVLSIAIAIPIIPDLLGG